MVKTAPIPCPALTYQSPSGVISADFHTASSLALVPDWSPRETNVAFAAAMSLWAMGDSSGGDLLEDVLTGKRSDGPGLIGGAMRSAKDDLHHPVDLATMGAQKTTGAFFGPASIGVGLARDAFKDKDAPSRAQIATLLGEGHGSGTIRMLEVALHDRSSMVRAAAAKSLGQAGNHEVIPKLVTPMLQDSSHTVRYAAAASVIRLNAQPR
jgi:hypothetical protein